MCVRVLVYTWPLFNNYIYGNSCSEHGGYSRPNCLMLGLQPAHCAWTMRGILPKIRIQQVNCTHTFGTETLILQF